MNGLKVTRVFFKEVGGSSSLKAFADVQFNGCMTIRGFKVFESRYGPFVKEPSEAYEKDGETKYSSRIGFPDDWYGKDNTNPVFDSILEEWTAHSGTGAKSSSTAGKGKTSSGNSEYSDMPY